MATVSIFLPWVAMVIAGDVYPNGAPAGPILDQSNIMAYCLMGSVGIHLISILLKPSFYVLTPEKKAEPEQEPPASVEGYGLQGISQDTGESFTQNAA